MPYKFWGVRLVCNEPGCKQQQLTGAGLHGTVRRVLDLDSYYLMATEYLECGTCKKKHIAWSEVILRQLAAGFRMQFPAILTYRFVPLLIDVWLVFTL